MTNASEDLEFALLKAPLRFVANRGDMPVAVVAEAGTGPDEQSGNLSVHEVEIHDAGPLAGDLQLDRQGFALRRYATNVVDFYDDDEIRRVYYPEMETLIEHATGASKVVVFDHTIRVDDEEKQIRLKVRGPVRSMHNDFTVRSAPQRVRDLLPAAEAEARLENRYASINVWRPIVNPVETKPLVICGYDSISDDDLVAAERRYPDGRIGGIYMLVHNPNQRWYYFPDIDGDEVVLLKCFDSLTDGTARWTAHGTFDLPDGRPNAVPRESIEVRTLLFYD